MQELETTTRTLQALGIASGDVTAASLPAALNGSAAGYALFLGHNDGGHFRFRDGSAMALADIAEQAAVNGKIPIFISCGSKRYVADAVGLHRELSLGEALAATESIVEYLRGDGPRSASDLTDHLRRSNKRYRVAYMVQRGCHVAAGLIVIAIVIYLLSDHDK